MHLITSSHLLELVDGPGGATLVEVDEMEESVRQRDSLTTAATIGGVPAQLDKQFIDKNIKTEVVSSRNISCYSGNWRSQCFVGL